MSGRTANILCVTRITVINLLSSFVISGVFVWSVGEDPMFALETLLYCAFGYDEGIGYTLYYTTNFIFTGLAFAAGFHCTLFNIGAEGPAYIGGLGLGLVCLWTGDSPTLLVLPLAALAAALMGGLAGAISHALARIRGSTVA